MLISTPCKKLIYGISMNLESPLACLDLLNSNAGDSSQFSRKSQAINRGQNSITSLPYVVGLFSSLDVRGTAGA